MKRIRSYISILRPLNVVIAFASVWIILAISGDYQTPGSALKSFLAALCAAFICGGSNIINDYFDIEIDRINKPDRVLVRGDISKKQALVYWFVLSAGGVILNFWINPVCLAIAAFSMAGLYGYSAWLKRTPLWGNLTVCGFTALAFIYGGLAIDKVSQAVFPAIFTFVFQFGRELLKDVEDIEGDRRQNAHTFPILYGIQPSLVLITLTFFLLAAVTVYAYVDGIYSIVYFMIVGFGLYPVLAYALAVMWKDSSPKSLNRINRWLKLVMVIGLAAIYAG